MLKEAESFVGHRMAPPPEKWQPIRYVGGARFRFTPSAYQLPRVPTYKKNMDDVVAHHQNVSE
jgi:hypothetical protein